MPDACQPLMSRNLITALYDGVIHALLLVGKQSLTRLSDLLQVELGSDVQDGLEVRGRDQPDPCGSL